MHPSDSIPFLDLVAPHEELEDKLIDVFRRALRSASFIGGPMVDDFEKEFAAFCNAKHAIAVGSGTDALRFAIMASGVQPGEVVVTVPNTFIATTEAISQAGAIPEFVDIDEATYTMSAEKLWHFLKRQCRADGVGRLISQRHAKPVTAILPVHLYGQMADMDAIMSIAQEHGLTVLEDACQAHGAQYYSRRFHRWMTAGSVGVASAFSFYPGKNLGACGEAGAVTTNDASLADKVRMLRDHGQAKKYHHNIEGYNGRLDAIQAGLLQVKLQYLPEWNARRRERAAKYDRLLEGNEAVIRPCEPSWSRGVYHLYVIRTANRDGLMSYLKEAGIGTAIHYPIPLHMQKAYANLNYAPADFPVTMRVAEEIVSLPMFPQLTARQQERIAEEIGNYTVRGRAEPIPAGRG